MSNAKRAHQNREYVRKLLKKKWPEFAAILEQAVWELMRTCDAPSAESAREGTGWDVHGDARPAARR